MSLIKIKGKSCSIRECDYYLNPAGDSYITIIRLQNGQQFEIETDDIVKYVAEKARKAKIKAIKEASDYKLLWNSSQYS